MFLFQPVAPLSHRREDEELYLAQLMACKNLYELECELKCALREKFVLNVLMSVNTV